MTFIRKSRPLSAKAKTYRNTYLGNPGETPTPNLAEREPRLYAVELLGKLTNQNS